jgi:hypothetical protein
MSYEVSKVIYNKLKEIESIAGSDFGEWENNEEEQLIESINNICIELGEMIFRLQSKKGVN